MLESTFKNLLIEELESKFKGCFIVPGDANYCQGFPDILILYKTKWAALECKRSRHASIQPNQEYYIDRLNKLSFAAFIYPENKEEILNELQHALRPRRATRLFESK